VAGTVKGKQANTLSMSYLMLGVVRIWILSVAMCLIAITARAQQNTTASLMPPATRTVGGWWSPDRVEATLVSPQFDLSTAKPNGLAVLERSRTAWRIERGYSVIEQMSGWHASQAQSELMLGIGREDTSFLIAGEPLPGSVFSFFNAKYTAWETGLSDFRSLTDVNGTLTYPLIEINYAHWRLPITLYLPPLRGSVSRGAVLR
jgi:hypothetical protein